MPATVYLIGPVEGCYKIGQSRRPGERVGSLNLPVELEPLATVTTSRDGWLEAYLHMAFAHRRTRGEWFRLTDEEVALARSVSHADTPSDLPAAVVWMHDGNAKERKPSRAFTTFRIYRDDGADLRELSRLRRQTIADVYRELCAELVREALARELRGRIAALESQEAS